MGLVFTSTVDSPEAMIASERAASLRFFGSLCFFAALRFLGSLRDNSNWKTRFARRRKGPRRREAAISSLCGAGIQVAELITPLLVVPTASALSRPVGSGYNPPSVNSSRKFRREAT